MASAPAPPPTPSGLQLTPQGVVIPAILQNGTPLTKVSKNKGARIKNFSLDADQGRILWKSKKSGIVSVETIKELRTGSQGLPHIQELGVDPALASRWITIIYLVGGQYKTLNVFASSPELFNAWYTTIQQLQSLRGELIAGMGTQGQAKILWERHYWRGADLEGNGRLEWDDVKQLCRRLNVAMSKDDIKALFSKCDPNNHGYLEFGEYQAFVQELKKRPDIEEIFVGIAPNGTLEYPAFEKWMKEVQKTSLTPEEVRAAFDKFAHLSASTPSGSAPPPAAPTTISLQGFTAFLFSAENAAFSDHHGQVWQDMTLPLSEYFISSSHNTYLIGNQLMGVSTTEGYIRALLAGCRSVEMDIYDGPQEPVITHGGTLTSNVSLRNICGAIRDYGFIASPFPIIISAEVHCGIEQQALMAKIFREVFGKTLVDAPLDPDGQIVELPSPEKLKGRVLLKAKNHFVNQAHQAVSAEPTEPRVIKLAHPKVAAAATKAQGKLDKAFNMVERVAKKVISRESSPSRKKTSRPSSPIAPGPSSPLAPPRPSSPLAPPANASVDSKLAPPEPSPRNSSESQDRSPSPAPPRPKMSLDLVGLIIYTVGVTFRGLGQTIKYNKEQIFSLSENEAEELIKQTPYDLMKHTVDHLVRIYPKGTRVDSSNYEPHLFWAIGAQLVTINWQTFDLGYMLMQAMFQRNGRSGYFLKPASLRVTEEQFKVGKVTSYYFDVTIVSAQQLPRALDEAGREIISKSTDDPYVEVTLHTPAWAMHKSTFSLSPDKTSATVESAKDVRYKTPTVRDNGFNPVWNHKMSIPFDVVDDLWDVVFVTFQVKDQDDMERDRKMGTYCVSLSGLEKGYRHLPLHDRQMSQYFFSSLFIHTDIRPA